MDRVCNAVVSFGVNFSLGYVLGKLVGGRRTGVGAGVVLGIVGAAGSWLLSGRIGEPEFDDAEPIQIEIE
jgi:hypothetical protein